MSVNNNQTVGFMNLKLNERIDDYDDTSKLNTGGNKLLNINSEKETTSLRNQNKRPKTA